MYFYLKLQEKVAKTACMSACQHIASRLMALLLDSEIKLMSMGAMQQFNLDVMQCERKFVFSEFSLLMFLMSGCDSVEDSETILRRI